MRLHRMGRVNKPMRFWSLWGFPCSAEIAPFLDEKAELDEHQSTHNLHTGYSAAIIILIDL